MRQSLPRIWLHTSYRDTSQNLSSPLTLWPPSLQWALETPPHHRRTCSNPSLTHPSPSILYYTAYDQLVHLGMWTWLPEIAGVRWCFLGPHLIHDRVTHHLPVVSPPALLAQRPPPPPLMRNGKGFPCLGSVFFLMVEQGQMVMRTTGHLCTNQPDEKVWHLHGNSLHPMPNMRPPMLLPHQACGSTEVL